MFAEMASVMSLKTYATMKALIGECDDRDF